MSIAVIVLVSRAAVVVVVLAAAVAVAISAVDVAIAIAARLALSHPLCCCPLLVLFSHVGMTPGKQSNDSATPGRNCYDIHVRWCV